MTEQQINHYQVQTFDASLYMRKRVVTAFLLDQNYGNLDLH